MLKFRLFAALAAFAALTACHHHRPQVMTDADMLNRRLDFVPTAGMSRADIEQVLGKATYTGRTKEGWDRCTYQIEGAEDGIATSMIYKRDGTLAYSIRPTEEPAADETPEPPVKIPANEWQKKGALSGATIFVSPGHGWIHPDTGWTTQRGLNHGTVEDHSNVEAVLQYLVPFLENAGATVYTTRERDVNPNQVILDAGSWGVTYTGKWTEKFAEDSYGGSQFEAESSTGDATASVVYTPNIPEAGEYAVYLWYREPVKMDADVANVTIKHAGGETHHYQPQAMHDRTWHYVGTYYFEEGKHPGTGSVTIDNRGKGGTGIVADAVRFGGGMGNFVENGDEIDKPNYEISGYYYAQTQGFHPEHDSRNFNTVSAMPMWAEWEMEKEERGKTIYFAWHTNASGGDGKSRGFSSYVYGPNAWGPVTEFTGFPTSMELAQNVQSRVSRDIQAKYDTGWRNIGIICRWLGETNPRNNNAMPASLSEYGFHDNKTDAGYILDPNFRRAAAKSTVQAIVKYYHEEMDGFAIDAFAPETPAGFAVTTDGANASLKWQAPPSDTDGPLGGAATGYRVYTSIQGHGFDNGHDASGTSESEELTGIKYYKVAATNDGGESWPSQVLAARADGKNKILLVDAFDRLDADMNEDVKGNKRGFIAKMNPGNSLVPIAQTLARADRAFDSATNEAVTSGTISLKDYGSVVWVLGQENGDSVFDPQERSAIRDYLSGGGRMLITGSEMSQADADTLAFFEELGIRFGKRIAPGGIALFKDRYVFGNGEGGTYPVTGVDTFAEGIGKPALYYADGGIAAVQIKAGGGKIVCVGFPIETVSNSDGRLAVMREAGTEK